MQITNILHQEIYIILDADSIMFVTKSFFAMPNNIQDQDLENLQKFKQPIFWPLTYSHKAMSLDKSLIKQK